MLDSYFLLLIFTRPALFTYIFLCSLLVLCFPYTSYKYSLPYISFFYPFLKSPVLAAAPDNHPRCYPPNMSLLFFIAVLILPPQRLLYIQYGGSIKTSYFYHTTIYVYLIPDSMLLLPDFSCEDVLIFTPYLLFLSNFLFFCN